MIAVFSGTSDGQKLVAELLKLNKSVVCFNATKYGGSLYEEDKNLIVYDHAMDVQEILSKINEHNINIVIDATHPFAEGISSNLIEITNSHNIKYLRFERPEENLGIKMFDSYDEILEELINEDGNILLTIGSNNLERFSSVIKKERIYARVLPTERVLKKCFEIGLTPKNILAVQGPFSKEMNKIMIKDYKIKFLVTKASGKAGGFKEKIDSALESDIKILVLRRPDIIYPNKYITINEIIREV